MRQLTGIQIMPLNTVYQLYADSLAGLPPGRRWLNLPEYLLSHWGGQPVSEYTNATHTQLVELYQKQWCAEIFNALGLSLDCAPTLVPPGTALGKLTGPLAALPAFASTTLIAPACHDTAAAIAGIPATGNDWAYISSGTWSLVGTLIEQPRNGPEAAADNFTNLGAVGDRICFHKNVNGMWLIRQCTDQWALDGRVWPVADLVAASEKVPCPEGLLDVDDPDLLLPERMPQRINSQRAQRGLAPLDESPANAPAFASLIFHSLAARYAKCPRPRRLPHRQAPQAPLHRRRCQPERLPQPPHPAGHRPRSLPRRARELHRRQLRSPARHPRRQPRLHHRSVCRTRRPLGRPLRRGPPRRPHS
jgi:rhamnulokinase